MTVSGAAMVNGAPARKQPVQAIVGAVICGQTATDSAGKFQLSILSASQQAGCATPGTTVTFRVGDKPATGSVQFISGETVSGVELTRP